MTSVFEGVFVGDIHFDKMKKLFPDNHTKLQINELKKPYEYALRNGVKNVFLLGDVCEFPRLSYESQIAFMRFLKGIKGVHTHVILGNHDFSEMGVHSLQPFIAMRELNMLSNVDFHTVQHLEKSFGVPVNFCPYPHIESKGNAVNLGHFEVSGSTGDNGRVIKKAVDIDEEHFWMMGHLHTPHDIKTAHYVGTLYQTNFGERLPKSFTHGKFRIKSKKLEKKLKRVANDPAFKLFNLPVETKHDLKQIEKNPLYLYKVFVHSNYDLEEKDLAKYSNIVDIKGYQNKEQLQALIEEEFVELNEQDVRLPSVTENLGTALKNKGANKKQIKRGVDIVTKLVSGLD